VALKFAFIRCTSHVSRFVFPESASSRPLIVPICHPPLTVRFCLPGPPPRFSIFSCRAYLGSFIRPRYSHSLFGTDLFFSAGFVPPSLQEDFWLPFPFVLSCVFSWPTFPFLACPLPLVDVFPLFCANARACPLKYADRSPPFSSLIFEPNRKSFQWLLSSCSFILDMIMASLTFCASPFTTIRRLLLTVFAPLFPHFSLFRLCTIIPVTFLLFFFWKSANS